MRVEEQAILDFRSDTQSSPTEEMRDSMRNASVGDDGFRTDATVVALEERVAHLLGAEAGVLTCSGTMSNLLAVLSLSARRRKCVVVAGRHSHIVNQEHAGLTLFASAHIESVDDGRTGEFNEAELNEALTRHSGAGAVVGLENAHCGLGGNALPASVMGRQIEIARHHHATVHIDGARIANAAVKLETDMGRLSRGADSVAISLYKGLRAPGGSVLCGRRDVIETARHFRGLLGGTVRQAGFIAAAGLVALDKISALEDDHIRAEMLANGLRSCRAAKVRQVPQPTNMIFAGCSTAPADVLAASLSRAGILVLPANPQEVRFVVHADHRKGVIGHAIRRCQSVFAQFDGIKCT